MSARFLFDDEYKFYKKIYTTLRLLSKKTNYKHNIINWIKIKENNHKIQYISASR